VPRSNDGAFFSLADMYARVGEPVAVVLWKRAAQPISNPVGLISTGGDGRNAAGQAPTGQYSADQ
jgi:hypothetical protein